MRRFACTVCLRSEPLFDGDEAPECCGQPMGHAPRQPSATTRETIDTGLMARRLDSVADVVDLQHRRNSPATIK